ncbi:heterokaryon incompatibility protein (HET) domain-containing protein [Pochonia chlamydosporia 170]|uniref:Heterokaryon incompatibility protein (HET) domain-containing protein n=1 Tax=Pochonia chlamydosporia 170 TaxID=1380566 RepID=A0A179FV62_METCM|nr:heterokaryon incompatibility protein (HET) domain-containing protein [Pochonia chlamydosporia 170]OAQ68963.1 heterokaryon incompatibility protein (HET) domain-containing protein [Pochonia chlamydosporia 170]
MCSNQQNLVECSSTTGLLNRLCSSCRSCFPSQSPWPWVMEFFLTEDIDGVTLRYTSIIDIHGSMLRGCHLCSLMLAALEGGTIIEMPYEPWINNTQYQIQMLPDVGGFVMQLRNMEIGTVTDLHFKPVYPCPSPGPSLRWTLRSDEMGTPTRIDKAMTCVGTSTMRLIDIGMDSDSNIHVIEVDSKTNTLEYITLSYRWNTETGRTSLRKENKQEFYTSIPTNRWPQIYRDAVVVARQLGVRYLWIDSLCIVQYDDNDWADQVMLMDSIYSNGLLNLAGIQADKLPGLAADRNPLTVAPCLLTNDIESDAVKNWLCFSPDNIRRVDSAPLYNRGWTFQERLLSKRTVHFGDQLFWECACLRASETFPLGTDNPDHPEVLDDAIIRLKVELQNSTECSVPGEDMRRSELPYLGHPGLHRLWCTIVRCYSRTQLSKAGDKLAALRGVVDRVILRFGLSREDYTAGLWKPCLLHQLLWARDGPDYSAAHEQLATCLATYFPSWSWASCPLETSFIQLESALVRSFVKLADIRHAEDNVNSPGLAQIVLSGRLIACPNITRRLALNERSLIFEATASVGTGKSSAKFNLKVELDGPFSHSCDQVDILPVMQPIGGNILGLVLSLQGSSMGKASYRRLGVFVCDATPLKDLLWLSCAITREGLTSQLEACLDTLTPFCIL